MEQRTVGIWIRVSTDMQVKDESPEHHERRARSYAELKDWRVAEVYKLEAVSGKSVMQHPETIRMLKDIKSGHISGLIFSKLARLARNTKELLEFSDLFKDSGADLISLAESIDTSSPAGRLFYTMIAAMATWEREEIADRVAASVPIRAKMGKPLGGQASFGYKWEGKSIAVDEKEAPVRKLIYELFLKHKRKKTVAKELNTMGHRTRNGGMFSDTTIGRLLRDSCAKGVRIANYSKSLGDGKKWIMKPEKEWVSFSCPAIISEELWNDCNAELDRQENKRKPGPKAVHLLSGYVYCNCGKKMYVYHENNPTYRCKPCKISIPSSDLEEIYYSQLQTFLLTDKDVNQLNIQSDNTIKEKEALLKTTFDKQESIKKKLDYYLELRLSNELNKEEFAEKRAPLKTQLEQINEQIPQLEAEIDFMKIQYMSADTVLTEARNLYDRWPVLPFEEKRNIVEVITDTLRVSKSDIHISLAYIPSPHTPLSLPNQGNRQHQFIPVLPFCEVEKRSYDWRLRSYQHNIQTIGDHIKRARIKHSLLQSDLAKILNVTEDCITNWEKNRCEPQIRYMPSIIEFLGYVPVKIDATNFGGRVNQYRILKGQSLKKMSKLLRVDEATLANWERNLTSPARTQILNLNKILSS